MPSGGRVEAGLRQGAQRTILSTVVTLNACNGFPEDLP
jgi:hypothetical protein